MPKSLPRRIEQLERASSDRGVVPLDSAGLLDLVERMGENDQLPRPPGFDSAWGWYAVVLEWVLANPTEPPIGYRMRMTDEARQRLWLCWDCPEISPAVDALLSSIEDWPSNLLLDAAGRTV